MLYIGSTINEEMHFTHEDCNSTSPLITLEDAKMNVESIGIPEIVEYIKERGLFSKYDEQYERKIIDIKEILKEEAGSNQDEDGSEDEKEGEIKEE